MNAFMYVCVCVCVLCMTVTHVHIYNVQPRIGPGIMDEVKILKALNHVSMSR